MYPAVVEKIQYVCTQKRHLIVTQIERARKLTVHSNIIHRLLQFYTHTIAQNGQL